MSRQVDLGQIVPSIQVGTTTTGSPSSQASVINVGTDLNPILNFTIPKGEAGAIHMIIVQTLPTHDIDESAIYLLPLENPTEEGNNYAEYVYIDNQWELLGKIGVQVDLTDYVKNTDYATSSKGGVIKASIGQQLVVNSGGELTSRVVAYSSYGNILDTAFISKGTLENVITGKGLVSNTDYASSSTGGVVKIDAYAITKNTNGNLMSNIYNYSTYSTASDNSFISKGTLENVLTARIGDIQTLLDNLNNGNGV